MLFAPSRGGVSGRVLSSQRELSEQRENPPGLMHVRKQMYAH